MTMGVFQRLRLEAYKRYIRKFKVGSEAWRKKQERLSRNSQLGFDNEKRKLFYMNTLRKCGEGIDIHPNVIMYFAENIELGNDILLNRGVFITARATIVIGDHVLIGPYTVLNSGNHIFENPRENIRSQGHSSSPIVIENDVWIGAHCVVLAGVTIKRGAIVAAGSIVNRDVDELSVVGGVPIRRIRKRGDRL